MIVVVSGATSSGDSMTAAIENIDEMAFAVTVGRYGNGGARRTAQGDKYAAVQRRVNELLSGVTNVAGPLIGVARIIAGTDKGVRFIECEEHTELEWFCCCWL